MPHTSRALDRTSSTRPGGTLSVPHSPQRTSGSVNVTVNGAPSGDSTVMDRSVARIGRSSRPSHEVQRGPLERARPNLRPTSSARSSATPSRSSASAHPRSHTTAGRGSIEALTAPALTCAAGSATVRRSAPQSGHRVVTG